MDDDRTTPSQGVFAWAVFRVPQKYIYTYSGRFYKTKPILTARTPLQGDCPRLRKLVQIQKLPQ
jgi:hypothetical protein